MRKFLTAAVLSLAVASTGLAVVPAAHAGTSPAAFCRELKVNSPDLYEGLATHGGCVSSIASVGADALEAGAFPSMAAAIGNCKMLERTAFVADGSRAYPYTFYGDVFSNVDIVIGILMEDGVPAEGAAALAPAIVANYLASQSAFTATNRAGCISVLRGLHSGELFGLIFPA